MSSTVRPTTTRDNPPPSLNDADQARLRDIDYAARAVETAIQEKFGRHNALDDLRVIAGERTIRIEHQGHAAAGTRDHLLAAVRASADYAALWQELRTSDRFDR
jgi:hypothetical protein